MDDTVGTPAPPPEAGLEDTLALPAAGTLIAGRYLLGQRVAHGGMGAIYAGTDNRLGRRVAVKLMLETVSRLPGFSERFEREARAASQISHPHCVVVHDFGVDQGRHYLVLEWVEGQSLAALVASEGPLAPERAAELMAQVCDGLSAAHARGIIHRDVKPENVMVSRGPDGRERAKLVDFGIARSLEASEPQLTQAGLTIGSPYFMSPEQAMADPVDPRSDVYSAGATLYYLLSGRRPYLGDRLAVLQQLVQAEPPDLPPALLTHPIAAITRRAMQKSREARQPSTAELSSQLGALSRQPAIASNPARTWRRPEVLGAAAAAGLAILIALGVILGGGDPDTGISAGPVDARVARELAEDFAQEQGLRVRKFKLEREQDRYSVELKGRGREVELEIDASTGEVRVRKDK